MGASDAAEMLQSAQAECVRLERELAAESRRVSALQEQIAAVMALHRIEHRYSTPGALGFSFGTLEEASDFGAYDPDTVHRFDICAHCGALEINEWDEGDTYRDSLWPCKTVQSLGYPATTHEGEK